MKIDSFILSGFDLNKWSWKLVHRSVQKNLSPNQREWTAANPVLLFHQPRNKTTSWRASKRPWKWSNCSSSKCSGTLSSRWAPGSTSASATRRCCGSRSRTFWSARRSASWMRSGARSWAGRRRSWAPRRKSSCMSTRGM